MALPSPRELTALASNWWMSLPPEYLPPLQHYYNSLRRDCLALQHGLDSVSHVSLAREVALLPPPHALLPLSTPSSVPTNPEPTTCGEPT